MKKQLSVIFSIVLIGSGLFFTPLANADIVENDVTTETDTVEQVTGKETDDSLDEVKPELPKSTVPKLTPEEEVTVETEEEVEKPSIQSIATVSSYADFAAAFNNKDVTEINLSGDIDGTGNSTALNALTRNLTINGNGHKLNIGSRVISLSYQVLDNTYTMKLDNASISNNRNGEGFFVTTTTGLGRWNLELSNITAAQNSVNRVAQVHRCQVGMSGVNNISTYYENFELGSFYVAKNATYNGNNYGTDWAIIDFPVASLITDTAFRRRVYIDDGANVNFTTTYAANGQSGWPAIWGYYKAVTVGVNATFKAKWGNDIIRANADTALTFGEYPLGLTILLKAGSVMDLDNTDDHDLPALNMDAGLNSITMEQGATLKATSDGIYGALAFDGGTNTFYANQPKLVDLKNKRTGYKAFINTIGAATEFTIENTDVSYWDTNVDDDANPTKSFTNVKKVNSKITNKWSSDPAEVATALNAGKVQRFATKYVEKGGLSISEVPTNISFGTNLTVPTKKTKYPVKSVTGNLKVTDTRVNKQNWQLGVTIVKNLVGEETGHVMKDVLHYKSNLGDLQLNDSSTLVEKHTNVDNDYLVSNNWTESSGFYLLIPAAGVKADTYGAEILWDVRDVPL